MTTGKSSFRSELQKAVERQQSAAAKAEAVNQYLDLWIADRQPEALEKDERIYLSMFLVALDRHLARNISSGTKKVNALFAELGLDPTSGKDRLVLLEALANVALPKAAGAKSKWDAGKYDDLWKDIMRVGEKYPEIYDANQKLKNKLAAYRLINEFPKKYVSERRDSTKEKTADSLRKRVAEAANFEPLVNPNLAVVDFDYVVRGDRGVWPPCAAGLPQQPSFKRGSVVWQKAKAYEDKLSQRTLEMLSDLGIYMTKGKTLLCRQAARKISRARFWTEAKSKKS